MDWRKRTTAAMCAAMGAAALATMAIGCGDEGATEPETDFDGVYAVERHTINESGCDGEGIQRDGDDYFRLETDGSTLNYYSCEAESQCDEVVNATKSFTTRDGDQWRSVHLEGDIRSATCHMTRFERVAGFDGNQLRLERRVYEGSMDIQSQDECTEDAVAANSDALSCTSFELVVAAPVE